jgi:triosephosphate isomerase
MRRKIVAGNWKMNLTLQEGATLVNDILERLPELSDQNSVVIASPFVHIVQTVTLLGSRQHIHAGAQNCYEESSGAYTGEISAGMLKSAGVNYVILGHSERRQYFGETNEQLSARVNQVLGNGMKVIFCCGEPLEIRDAGTENEWVESQLRNSLFHIPATSMNDVVIAYEPIWAIGTGRTATTAQAQQMHAHIRAIMSEVYGTDVAAKVSILYGGSCKPSNAAELFACADVDGGLIGGASLKADEFLAIVQAMVGA